MYIFRRKNEKNDKIDDEARNLKKYLLVTKEHMGPIEEKFKDMKIDSQRKVYKDTSPNKTKWR